MPAESVAGVSVGEWVMGHFKNVFPQAKKGLAIANCIFHSADNLAAFSDRFSILFVLMTY